MKRIQTWWAIVYVVFGLVTIYLMNHTWKLDALTPYEYEFEVKGVSSTTSEVLLHQNEFDTYRLVYDKTHSYHVGEKVIVKERKFIMEGIPIGEVFSHAGCQYMIALCTLCLLICLFIYGAITQERFLIVNSIFIVMCFLELYVTFN